MALGAILRECNNSFGYRKTSGPIEIMLDHGPSSQMTMSVVQGSATTLMNGRRGLIENNLDVRNLCTADIGDP